MSFPGPLSPNYPTQEAMPWTNRGQSKEHSPQTVEGASINYIFATVLKYLWLEDKVKCRIVAFFLYSIFFLVVIHFSFSHPLTLLRQSNVTEREEPSGRTSIYTGARKNRLVLNLCLSFKWTKWSSSEAFGPWRENWVSNSHSHFADAAVGIQSESLQSKDRNWNWQPTWKRVKGFVPCTHGVCVKDGCLWFTRGYIKTMALERCHCSVSASQDYLNLSLLMLLYFLGPTSSLWGLF